MFSGNCHWFCAPSWPGVRCFLSCGSLIFSIGLVNPSKNVFPRLPTPCARSCVYTCLGPNNDLGPPTLMVHPSVVFAEALVETALESGLIIGFVGAAEYLSVRYLSETKFSDVARLALWAAAVFASGVATAGPRRWLEKSQLFNVDVPIGKDWCVCD